MGKSRSCCTESEDDNEFYTIRNLFLDKFSFPTAVLLLVRFSDISIYMRISFEQHLMSRRLWQLCCTFPVCPLKFTDLSTHETSQKYLW